MSQHGRGLGQWSKLSVLIAATACAAFLRLHRIDDLPPADGYDAAYYGVDALRLLQGQAPRVMYPPNREPLFSYMVAGTFLLLGPSTAAIHLTSALAGILTVPLVYLVADALFEEAAEPLQRWAAPLAALTTAVSYWHLNWSRIGMRAILVPLFAAATVVFLWRGRPQRRSDRERGRTANLVMCGISLGLSLYTYQAARLLPALVVVGIAVCALARGTVAKGHWRQLIIVTAVSLLVFAPLGVHFVTHPGSFSRRVEEALVLQTDRAPADNLGAALRQVVEALLAFSFVGDRTPYSTIPGRPSLNPFLSILLFLGIGVSLLEVKKPSRALLLAWLGLMTIPAALAGKGPTAKRAIGTLPAVTMLIAVGALTPWTHLGRQRRQRSLPRLSRVGQESRIRRRWIQASWTVVLLGGFAYSGVATYRDYFIVWASDPDLPAHFQAHVSSIGQYIGDLPAEQRVYLSPELPRHPAIRFHSNLREDVRGYNGRVCFVAPSRTSVGTTYVIVPGQGDNSLDLLPSVFPRGSIAHPELDSAGLPFIPYEIPAGALARVRPTHALTATWADRIELLGYGLGRGPYEPGKTIPLTLSYLDLKPMEERYTVFVHLLGPVDPATGQTLWGQRDSEPCHGFYPTTSWNEGEIVIDRIELVIRSHAPSGTYRLGTGFYDIWTGERLPLVSQVATTENDVLILDRVVVDAGE